jgi:hypothetical protein
MYIYIYIVLVSFCLSEALFSRFSLYIFRITQPGSLYVIMSRLKHRPRNHEFGSQ